MMVDTQKGISRSNMLLALTASLLGTTALSDPSQADMYTTQPQSHMSTSRLNVPIYQPVSAHQTTYMIPHIKTQPRQPMPTIASYKQGLIPTSTHPLGHPSFKKESVYNYTSKQHQIGYGSSATTSAPRYNGYLQQAKYQPTDQTVNRNSHIVPTFMGSSFSKSSSQYQGQGHASPVQQLRNRLIQPVQYIRPQATTGGQNNFLSHVSISTPSPKGLLPPPPVILRSQLNVIPSGYGTNQMLRPTSNLINPLGVSDGQKYRPIIISSKTVGKAPPLPPFVYQQSPYRGGPLIINSSTISAVPVQPKRRTSGRSQYSTAARRTPPKALSKKTVTALSPKKIPTGTKQAVKTPFKVQTLNSQQPKKSVVIPQLSKTVKIPAPKQPEPINKSSDSTLVLGVTPFESDSAELSSQAKKALDTVAEPLKENVTKRIQLLAYAKANSNDISRSRRLSLSRALAVRSYLIEKGIQSTRIDVRALGSKTDKKPEDRVDIVMLQ